MFFNENIPFPEAAYKDFAAILENVYEEAGEYNLRAIPTWFKKKAGIITLDDVKSLAADMGLLCPEISYNQQTRHMRLSFDEDCDDTPDLESVCEILALVMRRYGITTPVLIRGSVDNTYDFKKMENYGGVVYIIHPGLVRRMTTDDLAKQMLKKFF